MGNIYKIYDKNEINNNYSKVAAIIRDEFYYFQLAIFPWLYSIRNSCVVSAFFLTGIQRQT